MSVVQTSRAIPPHSNGVLQSVPPRDLIEMLAARAELHGQRLAFTFLSDNDREQTITYAELDLRAREIAARLAKAALPGDRVLLIYPTGVEFVCAFLGCIYAGLIAVPTTYPKPRRPMSRLTTIAADCTARLALTTSKSLEAFDLSLSPSLGEIKWIATDDGVSDGGWTRPEVSPDDVCLLQYTSGSTSDPKGVMVTHANLIQNMELILVGNGVDRSTRADPARTGVFWIPAYHDMGLICGILGVLYEGGHSVLMSPTSFLQRPLRWLQTIDKYKAEVSGAPNFAFELCVLKIDPADRDGLDLSSWRVAFCSAEPVQAETMRRFSEAFESSGFSANSLYPCYGLAEATLMAAGNLGPQGVTVKNVRRAALQQHRWEDADDSPPSESQCLVGCGRVLLQQRIAIVDPLACHEIRDNRVGELWIGGPCVTRGYWGRDEESEQVFRARLADTGEGPFLRTGDLGFLDDGQLYVTGRVKDVIIIRGRNHYPQDIEHTAQAAHPALLHGAGCAFGLEAHGREQLVVVHEIDRHFRNADFDEVIRAMRAAVAEEHDVEVGAVALIRQAGLPRTTSGKKQRSRCRSLFLEDGFKTLAQWRATEPTRRPARTRLVDHVLAEPLLVHGRELNDDEIARLTERIQEWLLNWLIDRADASAADVSPDRPFADYGLDSLRAVEFSQEIEDWLGVQLSSAIAWKYPTPASMARYLALKAGGRPTDAGDVSGARRRRNAAMFLRILDEVEAMGEADRRRSATHVDPVPAADDAEAANAASPGMIGLCPHNNCGFTCCDFSVGNFIVLHPGELENAEQRGLSTAHLEISPGHLGGHKAVCVAKDTSICDNGYKPLDCASYPFFPTVSSSGEIDAGLKGAKCPLKVEQLTGHRAWVVRAWNEVAARGGGVIEWIRQTRLVGYERVDD